MLVLTRRPQEQILMPELGITITVLNARPGRVKLGIDAPPDIQITRPGAQRPEHMLRTTSDGKDDSTVPRPMVLRERIKSRWAEAAAQI